MRYRERSKSYEIFGDAPVVLACCSILTSQTNLLHLRPRRPTGARWRPVRPLQTAAQRVQTTTKAGYPLDAAPTSARMTHFISFGSLRMYTRNLPQRSLGLFSRNTPALPPQTALLPPCDPTPPPRPLRLGAASLCLAGNTSPRKMNPLKKTKSLRYGEDRASIPILYHS